MLQIIQKHQLVVFALVVVTGEVTLHTILDGVTVLIWVGVVITQLLKVTSINLKLAISISSSEVASTTSVGGHFGCIQEIIYLEYKTLPSFID